MFLPLTKSDEGRWTRDTFTVLVQNGFTLLESKSLKL